MQKINYPYILVLTAIIFTGLSGMYSAVGAEMVTVHMERGQQYYRSGNYDAALKEFRAVTEIDPGSLTAWENMYWTYRKMEKTDQAIDILKSLISVHPDRPRVLNMMAEAYTAKKDYEQALAVYQESLKEKPGQIDILASRCKILYWAGRHNDAVVCCREFLSSYPEQDEIRLLLAGLQMGNQIADYQAAIDNWKHLIEKRPKDFQLQIGLAKAYYRSESYRQAFEITRGVLELDVENLSALEILLNAAIRIQEFESAQDAIEKLKAVDPNHRDIITGQAQIHDGIAHKLYQEGDYENALERFLLARTLAPELPRLQENIGWTYRHLDRIDEAIEVWEELLDDQPNEVTILNLLARAYTAKRMYDKALLTYDRSLKIDPVQMEARFARAKIKRWTGDYHQSEIELSQLTLEYPEDVSIRYQLTRCLMRLQKYDEAVGHFEELILVEPENQQYRVEMARALYFCEQYTEALRVVGDVLADDPYNTDALYFLADDAESLGDYRRACQLLDSVLAIDVNNVPHLNKLADCAANIDDYPMVERATEKSLELLANQPEVRILYANALRINGSVNKAVEQYQQILKCNPNHIPALIGLKQCCVDRKDYKGGHVYLEQVLSTDKTNIYLMLDKAMLLAYAGEYDKSAKLMEDLLERVTTQEIVLILLYHGITKNQRSSIVRLDNFKAQMEVLSELGYSAVTTEDMSRAWKGEEKLPQRAVLITFDDARRDSIEHADPVLRDLSFKATMFAPVCIVEANDPAYCGWAQLKHYSDSGRWEIQSHGNFAHRDIVVNAAGDSATFLTHRQWLYNKSRPENDSEYRQRIDSDYRESRKILEDRLNAKVNAYAFPKGKFGQEECACADSVESNLIAVRKYFAFSFFQNRYGFNLVGDDPYLLKRMEVHETWTAQQLRDHIINNDPVRLVSLNLANVYRWAGQNNKAVCLYDKLLKDNPLDKDALFGKAIACRSSGLFFEARALLDQVLEQDSANQIALEQRERADRLTAPAIDNFISYFEDDNNRQRFKWGTSLNYYYSDKLTLRPSWARAKLKEKNFNNVNENEYSLGAIYRMGDVKYDMSYIFRDFSGADDAHNYSLIAEMPLFFDNIQFNHAYKNIETTRAAIQGIRYYENEISIRHVLGDRYSLYYRYRRNDYTDDNSRNSNRLIGLYRILNQPRLSAGCVFVHDDTFFNTPVYYTPDNLRMVQALFRIEGDVLKDLKYNLRYAVGYAKERGSGDEIVHDGSISLDRQAGERLEFGLLITFSDTPNYASKSMQLNLKYRF